MGHSGHSSNGFSPTLDLDLRRSPLQARVIAAGTFLPLALPPALNLNLLAVFCWCGLHVAWGVLEARRCGVLHEGRRISRVTRRGRQWSFHYGDGRRRRGELARAWSNRYCAYLELTAERSLALGPACLVWRDALGPDAYRRLRVHLRLE